MKRWICLVWAISGWLQAANVGQAPLIFREDWTATPPAIPLSQRDVANPELRVAIHGPGPPLVKKSFHDARAWTRITSGRAWLAILGRSLSRWLMAH